MLMRLGNARLVFVAGLDLPARSSSRKGNSIRRVAIDFVRRGENEWRFRAKISRGFEQVERAVGVNREIRLRIARRPIVRRLRGGVHDRGKVPPVLRGRDRSSPPASRISTS